MLGLNQGLLQTFHRLPNTLSTQLHLVHLVQLTNFSKYNLPTFLNLKYSPVTGHFKGVVQREGRKGYQSIGLPLIKTFTWIYPLAIPQGVRAIQSSKSFHRAVASCCTR